MNISASINLPITLNSTEIKEFCQRHQIRQLSLFGSVLKEDFTEKSDVDFLVDFEPEAIP